MTTLEQAARNIINTISDQHTGNDIPIPIALISDLRSALNEHTDTIAALNQRIDFLNAKWNESEPQYSTK